MKNYQPSKLMEQKLMGLVLLVICAFVLWLCSTGTTPEDQDATAVVLLALWGCGCCSQKTS